MKKYNTVLISLASALILFFAYIPLEAQPEIEKMIIKGIKEKGVGNRFHISEIQPKPDDLCHSGGSATLHGLSSGAIQVTTEYPEDQFPFRIPGGPVLSCDGLVLRFKGNIALENIRENSIFDIFEGFTFNGEKSDPLVFVLIKGIGFIYVKGKGHVTLKNGSVVNLQSKPK